jgi:hypothetical protein
MMVLNLVDFVVVDEYGDVEKEECFLINWWFCWRRMDFVAVDEYGDVGKFWVWLEGFVEIEENMKVEKKGS